MSTVISSTAGVAATGCRASKLSGVSELYTPT
jgi:hypothetical protein